MALEIRVPKRSYSKQQVTLGNRNLFLEVYYIHRNSSWYINIYDNLDQPILQGIKLTKDMIINGLYIDNRLPDGAIYILNYNDRVELSRESFTEEYVLSYFSLEELINASVQ